jgi:peroxiredoxin Q/BCP
LTYLKSLLWLSALGTATKNFIETMTLEIGNKAPTFKALDQNGKERTLEEFAGKKLVVYFYPKDNTPGCTAESCDLRDNYARFQSQGYEILGVSKDSAKSHHKFIDKYNLPFDLLVDEDLEVCNAFGVWGMKKFMGREFMGIIRTTFIIDEKGMLEDIITKVKTKEHTAQILKD